MNQIANVDRLPPYSQEAEEAVIGSMIRDNDCIADVVAITNDSHFYFDHLGKIFRAILHRHENNQATDLVTLFEELRNRKQIEDIGGPVYLGKLWDAAPTAANATYYAGIVREKGIARAVIHTSTELIRDAYDGTYPSDELLAEAERKVLDIASRGTIAQHVNLTDGIRLSLERIDQANRTTTATVDGIQSGYFELDGIIGGFKPGDMIVIAARPSVGKTALALNIMRNMDPKLTGLFVSLEQSLIELSDRMLFAEAKVDGRQAKKGISADIVDRLLKARTELDKRQIWIDDHPQQTMLRIGSTARRLRQRQKIDYVMIDYLQLIEPASYRTPRHEQVSDISRKIKRLARELKIPVIAMAQLKRSDSNADTPPRPKLSDLRESGSIEQDADQVLLLHPGSEPNVLEVIVGKNRNGPTGDIRLTFTKAFTRFDDYAPTTA